MTKAEEQVQEKSREMFSAKVITLDVENSEFENLVVLNAEQAAQYDIKSNDTISLLRRKEEIIVNVAVVDKYIQFNEIWVTKSFLDKYWLMPWDTVLVSFTKWDTTAMQAIRKKLLGQKITDEEIDAIVQDIQSNKIPDLVLSYFVASSFFYKTDGHELSYMTKATAYTWDMYRFPWIVAGKYCIGWVPWNETTMIVIPILASLGLTAPKTFSKAITSPAATGECVDVLMDIEFDKQEVIRLTDKVWACLVWNQKLNLAPANDRIIKVSAPLGMEPYARMISSIMAKNYAMWINHCLIDIPMGPTAKISSISDAKRVAKRFKEVWDYLGIKMDVEITEANQPIWNGIWACLQARDALRILQQHEKKSKDLEEKVIFLAGRLLFLCEAANSIENWENMAKAQLKNWEARKKMQEIIKAQNWDPHIKSESIKLWEHTYSVVAKEDCIIHKIDMKQLNTMVRWLWAPKEYQAWIYLEKKLGDKVKKWEIIYTMYSPSPNKLEIVKEMLAEKDFYTYKVKETKKPEKKSSKK